MYKPTEGLMEQVLMHRLLGFLTCAAAAATAATV
jgi:hypothetical protein